MRFSTSRQVGFPVVVTALAATAALIAANQPNEEKTNKAPRRNAQYAPEPDLIRGFIHSDEKSLRVFALSEAIAEVPEPIPAAWSLDMNAPRAVNAVRFSPDGRWLAATYERSTLYEDRIEPGDLGVRLFQIPIRPGDRGELLRIGRSGPNACVTCLAFSPDGRHLAAGTCSGTIYVWDLKTRERRTLARAGSYSFALDFAPDGESLYAGRHGGVERLAFPSGRLLRTYVMCEDEPDIENCPVRVYGLAVSPDGKAVAAGGLMWNTETGKRWIFNRPDRDHETSFEPLSVHFSPDGAQVAVAGLRLAKGDGYLRLGKPRDRVTTHVFRQDLRDAAFLPHGEALIIGGDDGFLARIRVKDAAVLATYSGSVSRILSVAVSPDGERFAASGEGGLAVWEFKARR